MLASSPVSILNHTPPLRGIPNDSISLDYALGELLIDEVGYP